MDFKWAIFAGVCEVIIFLLPLAVLIWKAATLANRVSKNEEDIKEMKTLVEKQNDAILDALKELNTSIQETVKSIQEVRTEVEVIKALRREEVNITKGSTTK